MPPSSPQQGDRHSSRAPQLSLCPAPAASQLHLLLPHAHSPECPFTLWPLFVIPWTSKCSPCSLLAPGSLLPVSSLGILTSFLFLQTLWLKTIHVYDLSFCGSEIWAGLAEPTAWDSTGRIHLSTALGVRSHFPGGSQDSPFSC